MTAPPSQSQPEPSPGSPLSARLKKQFGPDIDPTLSLESEPDAPPSSALIDKLRQQAPRGTRYKLLGEVARGGMGAIIKIWDDELRRTLAMKVVLGRGNEPKGDTPPVDSKTLGRFLEEAQVTGQLDHPGIVPVHELGLGADGRVYFTMRLVKGEDLRCIFEKVRIGEDGWNQVRALGVLLKVCEAMSYAHSKKVIHRDLKPANVMVGKFGEVYVMDWGLARVLGREDKHDLRIQSQPTTQSVVKTERGEQRTETPDSPLVTMDGDIVGTPSFMPPEQAKGQLDRLGAHSDVYSLGAMLYQLLTGQLPYVPEGAKVSQHTILNAVLHGPPDPIESIAPKTPPELVAICEKAMAREISARYADTEEFASDLRAYLEGRVVRAYEAGTWAETRKWVRRNKVLAASLAAALFLIPGIVTSGAFYMRARREAIAAVGARSEAIASAVQAQRNADVAARNERAALEKTNDVLALSAQKDMEDLVARAEGLWPAEPSMIPDYEQWLAAAHELIDGRSADSAKGLKKRPSLEEHKSKLVELRTKAEPPSAEQAKSERESHPKYAELLAKQSELTWQSRMLSLEAWPSDASVEAELAKETLPDAANALNELAWPLVDPDKPVYGFEVKALLLARRAVKAASESERGGIRDSLGWALFKLGRFDEALAEEKTALGEPGGDAMTDSSAKLKKAVSSWRGDELSKRREQRDALASTVSDLDRVVSARQTYDYADPEARWWDVQLSKLVSDLEALRDPNAGLMSDAVSDLFGWGVVKRYEFAKQIAERSIDGAEAKKLWSEAIASIKSSPKYGSLELTAQLGLLPIGADPDSGLWEFAHLQTGDPAVRGADGKLALTESTGLVFVLIPGGKFWMGAQSKDSSARNYDPQTGSDEAPVHQVELSAYFLSKYEMTQGQWLRVAARNPSYYGPSARLDNHQLNLTHPVEQVPWTEGMTQLRRLRLTLPTEAQWEFCGRAGTETPWWTGAERESLRGRANLADQAAKRSGARWADIDSWPDLDDDWATHAPVGSFTANAFGLHDTLGNVWEWCMDGYASYLGLGALDPIRSETGASARVTRGGSFIDSATALRSASRSRVSPEFRTGSLGLRPAKYLTP